MKAMMLTAAFAALGLPAFCSGFPRQILAAYGLEAAGTGLQSDVQDG